MNILIKHILKMQSLSYYMRRWRFIVCFSSNLLTVSLPRIGFGQFFGELKLQRVTSMIISGRQKQFAFCLQKKKRNPDT